nr:Chain P, GLY-GLY-LEU-SER [Mus musculus]6GB7_R Chain R, GLY-GLY-LEU-SER [Mus musculus]
EDAGGGGLSK